MNLFECPPALFSYENSSLISYNQQERTSQSTFFVAEKDLRSRAKSLAQDFFKDLSKEKAPDPNERMEGENSYTGETHPLPELEAKPFVLNETPYVLTTEIGQLEALEKLRTIRYPEQGIYLGFAFEFNYHVLAERPVGFALICDVNQRMHSLYQFIASTIIETSNRQEFLMQFTEALSNPGCCFGYPEERFAYKAVDYFVLKEFSWLHSDEKFLTIRDLYVNKKICHLNLNLVEDSSYFASLKQWSDRIGMPFDVIYVSNIPEWLMKIDKTDVTIMKANLLKILSPETVFIDAKQVDHETGEPLIRITQNISAAEDFPSFIPAGRKSQKMVLTHPKTTQKSGFNYLLEN